jgi:uncharacterized membrane protein YhaH (DUF805 family)
MNPLKLLWSFYGRIGRGAFVGGNVFIWALVAALIAAIVYLGPETSEYVPGGPPSPLATVLPFLVIFLTWSQLALAAKRFHDLGKAGWFCLLLFVPLVGLIAFIYLLFARGEDRDNQYGPSAGVLSVAARNTA